MIGGCVVGGGEIGRGGGKPAFGLEETGAGVAFGSRGGGGGAAAAGAARGVGVGIEGVTVRVRGREGVESGVFRGGIAG